MIPISNCWKYFPNNKGLVGGIIVSGVGMGTFVFNLVSTYLVNPSSTNVNGKDGLFPIEVADNLPKMVRTLVLCWVSIGAIGVALIFPYKEEKKVHEV